MCFFKKKKKVEPVKEEKKVEPVKEEKKVEPVKEEKKPAPAKKKEPVVEAEPEAKKQAKRSYHVVKREDGKWEVKFAGGKKAIKLFDTQAEAVEYTKAMAANQDGAMLVHNSKGKNKGRIKAK